MSNYSDLNQTLRSMDNAKFLILDSYNIQYYYDQQANLPPSYLFAPYDVILIPGWIHNEYSGSDGKVAYINSIDKPIFIIEEYEDYLEMIEYSDENLIVAINSCRLISTCNCSYLYSISIS